MDETQKSTILAIDDEDMSIMALTHILSPHYTVYVSKDGHAAVEMAEKFLPDIILLDIIMPEMDGYAVMAALKKSEKTKSIPVIFLTSMTDTEDEVKGLHFGAVDYIFKPFSQNLLLKRVEIHLLLEAQKRELQRYNDHLETIVAEKTKAVCELQDAIMETLAEFIERRDNVTDKHIENMQNHLQLLMKLHAYEAP